MSGVVIFALIVLIVLMGIWSQAASVVEWAVDLWRKKGLIIEYGPVEARCYGSTPRIAYTEGRYGALAILNNGLAFASRRYERFLTPINTVCWIGYIKTKLTNRQFSVVELLIIHCQQGPDWYVYAFDAENTRTIAQELSRRCKLDIVEMGRQRESYGPGAATRMEQDIYGQWKPILRGQLYLAPDRLLYRPEGKPNNAPIMLTQIQSVGAVRTDNILHELNPFSEDLLRIEYQEPSDAKPQVVGFLVHDAESWAYALQSRGVQNVTIQTGRKKKVQQDDMPESAYSES